MEEKIIENILIKKLSEIKNLDNTKLDIDEPFENYGIDSIKAIYIVGELEEIFNLEFPSTLLWENNTIRKLTNYIKNSLS